MPRFREIPPTHFSKLYPTDNDHHRKCEGCKRVGGLLRKQWRTKRETADRSSSELECQFHANYRELSDCAEGGCVSCRVFRRALLQNQITTWQAERLQFAGEIWARILQLATDDMEYSELSAVLEIRVRTANRDVTDTAKVFCMKNRSSSITNLGEQPPIHEMRNWLVDCHENHVMCQNLAPSKQNPTFLIKIHQNDDILQLVNMAGKPPEAYAALSYEWLGPNVEPGSEIHKAVMANKTKQDNISRRENGFPMEDLSRTIQDALRLARYLGILYLWVDSICIPKGSNWNDEGSKMHLVYGNAYVTICTCSSENATNGLLHFREAWRHSNKACRLHEQGWLLNQDMPLIEVRDRAPIFSRGWILQEERLSPRILYLCGQRAYWSCSEAQRTEGINLSSSHQSSLSLDSSNSVLRPPQEFLETRRSCQLEQLHQQWLDMVKDYVKRGLADAADRFDAISGLAAQYLIAYTDHNSDVKNQEYLAGLWRTTFAQDLAWCVTQPKAGNSRLDGIAPTWSWASLPLNTIIVMHNALDKSKGTVKLLETTNPSDKRSSAEIHGNMFQKPLDVVRRGASTTAVLVRGRFRKFVAEQSTLKDWSDIELENRPNKYDTSKYSTQPFHCRNTTDGRVLMYEPGKEEIVGQMDYLFQHADSDRLLKSLCCLEISKESMLLLRVCQPYNNELVISSTSRDRASRIVYQRVGICNTYRETFFQLEELREITLV